MRQIWGAGGLYTPVLKERFLNTFFQVPPEKVEALYAHLRETGAYKNRHWSGFPVSEKDYRLEKRIYGVSSWNWEMRLMTLLGLRTGFGETMSKRTGLHANEFYESAKGPSGCLPPCCSFVTEDTFDEYLDL